MNHSSMIRIASRIAASSFEDMKGIVTKWYAENESEYSGLALLPSKSTYLTMPTDEKSKSVALKDPASAKITAFGEALDSLLKESGGNASEYFMNVAKDVVSKGYTVDKHTDKEINDFMVKHYGIPRGAFLSLAIKMYPRALKALLPKQASAMVNPIAVAVMRLATRSEMLVLRNS